MHVHSGGQSSGAGCPFRAAVGDLSGKWILRAIGNVVDREHNDVLGLDARLLHELIGVANIRLVAVVSIARGAGNQDRPVVVVPRPFGLRVLLDKVDRVRGEGGRDAPVPSAMESSISATHAS